MTLRLYMDEDAMDRHLVRAVRARGIDILTALEVGMIERTDEEHLWYAAIQLDERSVQDALQTVEETIRVIEDTRG